MSPIELLWTAKNIANILKVTPKSKSSLLVWPIFPCRLGNQKLDSVKSNENVDRVHWHYQSVHKSTIKDRIEKDHISVLLIVQNIIFRFLLGNGCRNCPGI